MLPGMRKKGICNCGAQQGHGKRDPVQVGPGLGKREMIDQKIAEDQQQADSQAGLGKAVKIGDVIDLEPVFEPRVLEGQVKAERNALKPGSIVRCVGSVFEWPHPTGFALTEHDAPCATLCTK